jgi:integrase
MLCWAYLSVKSPRTHALHADPSRPPPTLLPARQRRAAHTVPLAKLVKGVDSMAGPVRSRNASVALKSRAACLRRGFSLPCSLALSPEHDLLLSRGYNGKFVQELLGHAAIAITLDTYSHEMPGMANHSTAMEDALNA